MKTNSLKNKCLSSALSLGLAGLLAPALQAASPDPLKEDLDISAVLRVDDNESVRRDFSVAPDEEKTVELTQGYSLEITAPEDNLEMGIVRLRRESEDGEQRVHTLRDAWRGEGWPTLGYKVCGDRFSFFSLDEDESLPRCQDR